MSRTVVTAGPDGPVVVTTLEFGVKSVIKVICILVALYNKHRVNAQIDLPAPVIAALDVLDSACAELMALNPHGPA